MIKRENDLIDDLESNTFILELENKDFLLFNKKEKWFKKEENTAIMIFLLFALLSIQYLDWQPNSILLGAVLMGGYLQYKFWSNEWKFSAALNIIDVNPETIKTIPIKTRLQIGVCIAFISIWKILLVVLTIRYFIIFPVNIPSESMLPSLKVHDYVWVKRYPVIFQERFKKGDVIVFDTHLGEQYIKRIVATGGDVIHINKNKITVNEQLEDSHSYHIIVSNNENKWNTTPYYMPDNKFQGKEYCQKIGGFEIKCVLPANSYFVLGDNRDHSNDSRYIGLVLASQINGLAFKKNLFNDFN